MRPIRNLAAICLALTGYCASALACGAHDPTLLAQGFLNHTYPNALHVVGAIQKARSAGELPGIDLERFRATGETRKALDQIAFANTLNALYSLGKEIDQRYDQEQMPDIAVVDLKNMLWSRYSSQYFDIRQGLHVKGPEPGDLVLVTEESVIETIRNGEMSVARAVELGLLRIYTSEQLQASLLDQLGSIGEEPLPPPPFQWQFADWRPELG